MIAYVVPINLLLQVFGRVAFVSSRSASSIHDLFSFILRATYNNCAEFRKCWYQERPNKILLLKEQSFEHVLDGFLQTHAYERTHTRIVISTNAKTIKDQ